MRTAPVTIHADLSAEVASLEAATASAQAALDADLRRLKRLAQDPEGRPQAIAEAFGNDASGEPFFTADDVQGWLDRAAEMGAQPPRIGPGTVAKVYRREVVPNAHLRERFLDLEARGLASRKSLALAIGETRVKDGYTIGDSTRVARLLGLDLQVSQASDDPDETTYALRLFVDYATAVAITTALDLDPYETGV